MAYTVTPTPALLDAVDRQEQWYRRHRTAAHADRWYDAVFVALDELAGMPESYALCLDPAVQDRDLREKYFGAAGADTHRLIFRVAGSAVEVFTVRGFGQDELTPRDL